MATDISIVPRITGNPLAPYTWEAHYYGGGKLGQFDPTGYHNANEIELPRLEKLVVLGHPSLPIVLARPYDRSRPIKQVLLFARNMITMGGEQVSRAVEFYQIGYIYDVPGGGIEEFYIRIYPNGAVHEYTPYHPQGIQTIH